MEQNTRAAFIRQMLKDESMIEPSPEFSYKALVKSRQDYDELYRRSIDEPEAFWGQMARETLDWYRPWDAVEEYDFESSRPFVRYFRGAELNASANCLDRHLEGPRRNKAALIWQGEPSEEVEVYIYQRLHREVCKAANVLKDLGVGKGDRVVLYLPMIPQLAIAMLACARIGAVHCVVFSGLSADALRDRILDSGARVVVTANYGYRSGKIAPQGSLRQSGRPVPPGEELRRRAPHREAHRDGRRARPVVGRPHGRRRALLRARAHGGERAAVRALHQRQHGQAEGHRARYRRLPAVRLAHHEVRVRPEGDGHLLVHGRCGVDHGALVSRVRAARQRRHVAHVRGRAQLPEARPLLGGRGEVRREHPLHGPHGHPLHDEGGRAVGERP